MKIILLIVSLSFLCSELVGEERGRKGQSILKLITDPKEYHGEEVITTGYLKVFKSKKWHPMNGMLFMYPTKEYAKYDFNFSLIVIDSDDDVLLGKLKELNGTYIVLEGRFESFNRTSNIFSVPADEEEFGSGKLSAKFILDKDYYYLE